MTFRKYNSIENSYRNKTVDKIKELGFAMKDDEWVVTEKVHGANFQIATDGTDVWFSSRNGKLEDDDNFYGYHTIAGDLVGYAIDLYLRIKEKTTSRKLVVRVYGELFGGGYNHPDVPKLQRKKVQDGVQYSPDIGFYAYDIFVEDDLRKDYLDHDNTHRLLKQYFFTASVLYRGSLDECLQYRNEYTTTIPSLLGYPMIEGNICEGNVIKPVISRWFPHSDPEQRSRVVLKNKNEKFTEGGTKKEYQPVEVTELGEFLLKEGLTYVNENRYNAVISKIGEIDYADTSNIGKLIGMMIKDTMQDFAHDNEELKTLEKRERGHIQKVVTTAVRTLVLEKF